MSSALLNLADNITTLDKNIAVGSVTLDYAKGFDMLDHELMSAKLSNLGLTKFVVISLGNTLEEATEGANWRETIIFKDYCIWGSSRVYIVNTFICYLYI